jgi:hypothetical protein
MAGIWYTGSYIPFGRIMITVFLKSTICGPCFQCYDSIKETVSPKKKSSFLTLSFLKRRKSIFFYLNNFRIKKYAIND